MLLISIKELSKEAQHSHAHRLLRECLKPYGIDYTENTAVEYGELGKPSLKERPDIHYNVSHAEGIAVAVSGKKECGVDAESVRAYRPNVIKRAFSEREKTLIEATPEEERDLLFFRLWTLKESYVKAIGIGVSYPMNTVEFSFEGDRIVTDVEGYSFRQYILGGGAYVVSVCEKL